MTKIQRELPLKSVTAHVIVFVGFLHLQLLQAFQARSQKRSAYTLHMDEISPALSSMKGSAVYMPGQTHFSGKVTLFCLYTCRTGQKVVSKLSRYSTSCQIGCKRNVAAVLSIIFSFTYYLSETW